MSHVPLPPLGSRPSVDPFCSTSAISVASIKRSRCWPPQDKVAESVNSLNLSEVELQGGQASLFLCLMVRILTM